MQHSGFRPTRSIELILFTRKSQPAFGIGCLGSRMLSGALTAEAARKLQTVQAKHGTRQAKKQICKVISNRQLESAIPRLRRIHISKPSSGARARAVGHCRKYRRSGKLSMDAEGQVAMPVRPDARSERRSLRAAEIILTIEEAALASGSTDICGTVGICDVFPAAVTAFPAACASR